MFNQELTIINKKYFDGTTNREYRSHHIKGFWSNSKGISINGVDLVKDDSTMVRILMSEPGYNTPEVFQKLDKGWTLQNDDYIIKGYVELPSEYNLSDIKDNYEAIKITKVAVKDYGSKDMHHFEVSGN